MSSEFNGKQLDVTRIGCFNIEWYLGGDLKIIKCLLGCKLGAKTKFSCIYCCHFKTPVEAIVKGKEPSKGNI